MRRGFLGIGVEDNDVLAFPQLMDSASLFLTANCDTMYYISFLDLTAGPMVVELPALGPPTGILGGLDDMWFNWVTDMGLAGPDRGAGGRYLIVGPDYDGPLPDAGYFVSHCRTTRAWWFARAFKVDNDPAPPDEVIRNGLKIYPYQPGGVVASGDVPLRCRPVRTRDRARADALRGRGPHVVQHGPAGRRLVLGPDQRRCAN